MLRVGIRNIAMGAIYKRKRRSCGLCKPHKRGWAPKHKDREQQARKRWRIETEEETADAPV